MAAPTPTARGTPGGIVLNDGFPTKITFARFPTVSFREKSVQPGGWDGGDKIDTTTMFNVDFRTSASRQLIEMTDGSATVAYDPGVYATILQMINVLDTITYSYPDGSTLAVWGYLSKFEPSELTEGEQPEAEITIVHTCQDEDGAERAPVITSVAGT